MPSLRRPLSLALLVLALAWSVATAAATEVWQTLPPTPTRPKA